VVQFVASARVPLVPAVAEIQPIGIPVIEPLEKKTTDTDLEVVLDIALQTLGIFEAKTLVEELLKDKDISTLLHQSVPELKEEEWTKLLEVGEKIFKLVIAHNFVRAYAARIGRKFAFRLALRCVPIAGWVYLGAAFVIALKVNYKRFSFT
jgi:hypothetical protein